MNALIPVDPFASDVDTDDSDGENNIISKHVKHLKTNSLSYPEFNYFYEQIDSNDDYLSDSEEKQENIYYEKIIPKYKKKYLSIENSAPKKKEKLSKKNNTASSKKIKNNEN